ncbi:MAG: hypothetical protein ABEJ79_03000 [Halolamina sp.]
MANDGDIRVLLAMDLLLSAGFAGMVLWGTEYAGIVEFSTSNLAGLTAVLAVVTYLVVLR